MSDPSQKLVERAMQLQASGRLDEASALYRKLLAKMPGHPDLHHLYGLVLTQRKDFSTAEKHLRQSLALRPDTPPYLNSLGMLYLKSGATSRAEQCLARAMSLAPAYADPVLNLGNLRMSQQRYADAAVLFAKGAELGPNNPVARLNLGNAMKRLGQLEAAAENYRRAVALDPGFAQAHYNLGLVEKMRGCYGEALRAVEAALSRVPDYLAALMLAGEIHEHLGDLEQATRCYQSCIAAQPDHAAAYWGLANLGRYRFTDSETDRMQTLLNQRPTDDDRILLHFALAKALEQQQSYADSFGQLRAGNELQRRQFSYSTEETRDFMARQAQVFTRSRLRAWPQHGLATVRPIFIVGMPRSGTSLVEQILSGHRQVAGGGELETSLQIVHSKLPEMTGKPADEALRVLEPAHLRALGEFYCRQNRSLVESAERFTDKLPFNFALIGMLACLFPEARFVHVHKHPMDACLGCYKQLFTQGQLFSCDLDELGDFYIEYRRIMRHWQEVVPERIINIGYEQLVAEPARVVARLLEFLGLPWQDECLDLESNRRVVRTASAGQVRAGIDASAVDRWRHYAAELQPLADKLRAAGVETWPAVPADQAARPGSVKNRNERVTDEADQQRGE